MILESHLDDIGGGRTWLIKAQNTPKGAKHPNPSLTPLAVK
jgi:hypothetical protein